MCNEYAREKAVGQFIEAMEEMKNELPFSWAGGHLPNNQEPKSSIKIRDKGFVCRLKEDSLSGEMMTWAWRTPLGKPVFNVVSDGRDFSESKRWVIAATGFYEYTTPRKPKIKIKDQHFFTLKGSEWFWIAGIVKEDCFAMLTTEPGPDISPYHDRQICVLPPGNGMDWLQLSEPDPTLLASLPKGSFYVRTLRRDGVSVEG
jgi:putative SOS response-associated peptidase YedK